MLGKGMFTVVLGSIEFLVPSNIKIPYQISKVVDTRLILLEVLIHISGH